MSDNKKKNINEIEVPRFYSWTIKDQLYDYEKQIADYSDLKELGASINAARIALFKATEQINRYELKEREAKIIYDRSYRRQFLASTEKTDSLRKNRALLLCEELENNYIKYDQIKEELIRVANVLRIELQTLQSIGNNMRQQMKME